jgi:hypothetical protein
MRPQGPRVMASTFLSLTYMHQGPIPDISALPHSPLVSPGAAFVTIQSVKHECKGEVQIWVSLKSTRALRKVILLNSLPKWSHLACRGGGASLLFCLFDLQNHSTMASVSTFYTFKYVYFIKPIGSVHMFVQFSKASNNLFFTQIINQSIMYYPPLFTTASRFLGRFSIPHLISASLAVKKSSSQFWRKLRADCWREGRRGGNPMGQGPESRADVEESPSRVFERPLSPCLQCVVGRYHAGELLRVGDPGVLAGLLPTDGEDVDNSIQ